MISKKYIKELEFKTIEDIFNYIVESVINGNFSQVKEMVNELSSSQFKLFMNYCKSETNNPDKIDFLKFRWRSF